jgi:hypothetical protein
MPNKQQAPRKVVAPAPVKGPTAVPQGLTGVFRTLALQHKEAAELLTLANGTEDPDTLLDLWSKIRTELLSHERAEARVVFPELLRHVATKAMVAAHEEQASTLEEAILELDSIDTASDDWQLKLEALIRTLDEHIDVEEGEWFPEALTIIGADRAAELTGPFLAAKEAALEELG